MFFALQVFERKREREREKREREREKASCLEHPHTRDSCDSPQHPGVSLEGGGGASKMCTYFP